MAKRIKILICFFALIFSFKNVFAFSYWDEQRKGANIFNKHMTNEIWQDVHDANIKVVRLAPDKWKGKSRDFLIGNADHYQGLVPEDLAELKKVLKNADKNGVKVVLTLLSLPGDRWRQLNHNRNDSRLWQNENYQTQAIHFWQDLAKALKGNPAIVGYNIINEPHPEIDLDYQDFTKQDFQTFSKKVTGTTADLNLFYQKIVDAVHKVDPVTPIILDVGMYADPRSFSYFKPVTDQNVLYSFHMYEPYSYTNKKLNGGKYTYPGKLLIGASNKLIDMNKQQLKSTYFQPVIDWQKKYGIPSSRIFVGEFGGDRFSKGLDHYFRDLIAIFDEQKWHWAFYAFREDLWDSMDYELGTKPLPVGYWMTIEKGGYPAVVRCVNPVWNIIKNSLDMVQM